MSRRNWIAALVFVTVLSCSGQDGTDQEGLPPGPGGTGGTGGGGGAGGVPPPIVHEPPVPLGVQLLGPEVDAPRDVSDLSVDPEGDLWLVAADGLHVRPAGETFLTLVAGARSEAGAPPSSVAALSAGTAVVGYPDGRAHLVTLGIPAPTLARLALVGPVPRLEAVTTAGGRVVLAGTARGLARVSASGAVAGPEPLPAPSSAIWALSTIGPDVWAGDEFRAARLANAAAGPLGVAPALSIDLVPDAADSVVALAPCPNGELWASALGAGVVHLSSGGQILERLRAAQVLPQDHVLSLACDLDGTVWFGTSWGGLARRTPGGAFLYYARSAGLPGDSIRRLLIAPDALGGRTLWIATEGGAAAYTGP